MELLRPFWRYHRTRPNPLLVAPEGGGKPRGPEPEIQDRLPPHCPKEAPECNLGEDQLREQPLMTR